MDNNMDNNMNSNEFYVLYFKNKNDCNYLESLTPTVLKQTQLPEEAKRFKTIFDAKIFFFDNFKHIQNKFFSGMELKDVVVAKIIVKYNVSFCEYTQAFYPESEDDPDSVMFALKRD